MGALAEQEQRNLIWGMGGCLLLALILLRSSALALGEPGAKLAVGSAMCLLALLAAFLLLRHRLNDAHLGELFFLLCTALFLRLFLLDHQTADYRDFLSRWAEHFRTYGGLAGLKEPLGDYNVPYLFFLALISYLPVPDLYMIKLFSVLFDVLLAWGGYRLTVHFTPQGSVKPTAAFCLLLLLPTVLLNGSCWGQCDSLYAALCLHALVCGLKRQGVVSVLLLSLAFSFKLQTVFLIPVWCILWFAERVTFKQLLLFPAGYLVSILPALLAGRSLSSILGIYLTQATEYSRLTLTAPSLYALLPNVGERTAAVLSKVGIVAAFALVLFLLALLYPHSKGLRGRVILLAAAIMALGVPLLLPHMHDRYFFLADCLVLIVALLRPRQLWAAPLLVQVASLGAYHAYLRLEYAFPMGLGALMNLAALLLLLRELRAALRPSGRSRRRERAPQQPQ